MSSPNLIDPKGLKRPLGSHLPLVIIVGPTGVGKTDLAIELAERLDGEIISADSRLFYEGMDIGTAKPPPETRARVPHHLIDVTDPAHAWSLAVFQQAAARAIGDVHERGRLPFLVGGTGQYIHAVIHGWKPPEIAPDASLRKALDSLALSHDPIWLHDRLAMLDPAAARTIDPRNLRRTVRALEVILSTGQRFSSLRVKGGSPYRTLTIGLVRPRLELYARIDARIEAMFADGLLEEVRGLLAKGYSPGLPAMSAIGYCESVAVIQGKMTLEEAQAHMRRLTRVFVRRQANWFKPDDPDIHWFNAGQDVVGDIEALIRRTFLAEAP